MGVSVANMGEILSNKGVNNDFMGDKCNFMRERVTNLRTRTVKLDVLKVKRVYAVLVE